MVEAKLALVASLISIAHCLNYCGEQNGGPQLEYVVGDALTDSPNCLGPTGVPYPM